MTSYNGQTITYDAIGNPLNDGIWSYEWQAGRQLKRMSAEGTAVSFKYDYNGLRTQKIVEQDWYPITTNYTLHGKLITHMNVNYYDWDEIEHNDVMHFFYDAQSRPAMVEFNGTLYTYVHNLQSDIVGILDSNNSLVVEYKYDAWGKLLSTTGSLSETLGKRNPFRYRGYVYDEETGLYYLRSRYYNAEKDRFINADAVMNVGQLLNSSFAYCSNNPIVRTDAYGRNWLSDIWSNIVNAYNGISNEVKRQAGIYADVNRRFTKTANRGIDWLSERLSDMANSVSDWWKNTAKPWLNQAKETVKTLWNNVQEYKDYAFEAQRQYNILSAQMTCNAACVIENNWKEIVRYSTYVYTGGSLVVSALSNVGKIVVSPHAAALMWIADAALWVYGIGNDEGWW